MNESRILTKQCLQRKHSSSEDTSVFLKSECTCGHIFQTNYSCPIHTVMSLFPLPPACTKYHQDYRGWKCRVYIKLGNGIFSQRKVSEGCLKRAITSFLPLILFPKCRENWELRGILFPKGEQESTGFINGNILHKSNLDYSPHIVFKLFQRHLIIFKNFIEIALADLILSAYVSILFDCYS